MATSIERGPDWFEIDGGVGLWGVDGDAGYQLRARVVCADDACEVMIVGMNYVPALTESLRNRRNVGLVARSLVA